MTGVDVWLTAPRPAVSVRSLLAGDEWLRLLRLRRPDDRNRSATGRAVARLAVAAELGRPPASVRFDLRCAGCGGTDHGKPYVHRLDPDEPTLEVSVSHAGGLVAVSLAPVPVGLDVEESAPARFAGVAQIALTAGEQSKVGVSGPGPGPVPGARGRTPVINARAGTPEGAGGRVDHGREGAPAVDHHAVAAIWVRKEALLKCVGVGLARDLRTVELGPRLGRDTVVEDASGPVAIADLTGLPDGYLGAVAVTGRDVPTVRLRDAASLWDAAAPVVRTPTT